MMNKRALAGEVIESLRKGTPPERGVSLYSVGHEGLMDGIQKRQFRNPSNTGIIRFINGSYGSGKTHVFRILRELAYKNKRIVSTIEVRSDEAPFNKFEKVLHSVIRNISTPEQYATLADFDTLPPFGFTMKMALERLSGSNETGTRSEPTIDNFIKAREKLMSTSNIDIDFKKMVAHYWQTFMPESEDIVANEIRRGEIMQWFSGEGTVAQYRRKFEVNKMVSRDTSKTILESLVRFVQLAGYKGVVILFDEAEQSYSTMRRSQLREAQNNLLHFINTIGPIAGLYMVYATTPDFYMDPKHGIGTYPALASRIGLPSGKSPKALDIVWDLDAISLELSTYQQVAHKIRRLYEMLYPDAKSKVPNDGELDSWVAELYEKHPKFAGVRFWRVLVTALVSMFDSRLEGEKPESIDDLYEDIMNTLRED